MQYKLSIKVDASGEAEVKQLGTLLQKVLSTSDKQDVIRLLDKVAKNPLLINIFLAHCSITNGSLSSNNIWCISITHKVTKRKFFCILN